MVAMLLFFMGGFWFYPIAKEIFPTEEHGGTILLMISALNQLSCFAFILGADPGSLKRGSQEWKKSSVVLIAILVGLVSVCCSVLWIQLLTQLGIAHDTQSMAFWLKTESGEIKLGVIVFVVLIAPIVEELLFRNLLLSSLFEKMEENAAIVLTGCIFGLMHLESKTSVPPLILFGILLGILRLRYKSVMPAIIAHFVNNIVVACFLIFS